MSGLSLRALLEGSHLSLDLKVNGSAASPLSSQDSVSKVISPSFPSYDASRAYLNRANIWDAPEPDASGGDGGFNLEYMDLEEFLQETGLETLDRAAIFSSSPAAYVDDSSACSEVNCSATPAATAPGMSAAMTSALHSPSAAARLTASPATLTTDVAAHAAASVASAEAVHLSSQPSSPADSCDESSTAGSVDGSVTIADVPGKEGFDPESHKFAPEELVPQPIIKKSRKVYVPDDLKDDRYWARRKKNNYAAKRSRDARRAKENQIIMRAAFLEQHNDELSTENKRLLAENKSLTALVQAYKKRLGDN